MNVIKLKVKKNPLLTFFMLQDFINFKRLASYEVRSESRNFFVHFLFSSKIKTTYPGVHPPISSLALRPKLGLWWSYHVLDPILGVLTRLTKQHKA